MTKARAILFGAVLAAAFAWGALRILHIQFSSGDFYSEYSSLRTDAEGSKLLFDALSHIDGLSVERNYLPLAYLNDPPGTVLLLGLHLPSLNRDFLQLVEELARRGNRVIVSINFDASESQAEHGPLNEIWHIDWTIGPERDSGLWFSRADGWDVIDRRGPRVLAVQRSFGPGRVLFFSYSEPFSNGNLVSAERFEKLSATLGSAQRLIFDESHFGIVESGSVAGLIRRFGLTGLALGLAIVAALVLWKNTAAFPPRSEVAAARHYTGRTSFEGLLALLQRHVRPKDLVRTCWEEFIKSNRRELSAERIAQAAAIVARASDSPLEALREIRTGLRAKGEF